MIYQDIFRNSEKYSMEVPLDPQHKKKYRRADLRWITFQKVSLIIKVTSLSQYTM